MTESKIPNKEKVEMESQRKKEIYSELEKEDPDWMYKSILKGAFSRVSKTDKDVIGERNDADYTIQ